MCMCMCCSIRETLNKAVFVCGGSCVEGVMVFGLLCGLVKCVGFC